MNIETGIALTSMFIMIVGILATAFRNLSNKIGTAKDQVSAKIEASDATLYKDIKELHTRVNEVREKYVRRDDLEGHLNRIDRTLADIRDSQKLTNEHLMQILKEKRGDQ